MPRAGRRPLLVSEWSSGCTPSRIGAHPNPNPLISDIFERVVHGLDNENCPDTPMPTLHSIGMLCATCGRGDLVNDIAKDKDLDVYRLPFWLMRRM